MQELAIPIITTWLFYILLYFKMKKTVSSENYSSSAGHPKATTVLNRRMAGSNWQTASQSASTTTIKSPNSKKSNNKTRNAEKWTKFVAMDCEMVGIGANGQEDMLARVTIVNQNGDVLIDKCVKAQQPVIDYRTRVSGIRPRDMENGEDFAKVQNEVMQILRDKVLVGHSINNDLAVLKMRHPRLHIRDTAKYRPLAKLVSNGATPSLKRLAKAILGVDIQTGEHNSVEDARTAMLIYVRFSAEWERYNRKQNHRTNARNGRPWR